MKKYLKSLLFGVVIIAAFLLFELTNYSITSYALTDLLRNFSILGLSWVLILSTVFCLIDFFGIARLFSPEQGDDMSDLVWFAFAAWFLGALLNAIVVGWGVYVALQGLSIIAAVLIAIIVAALFLVIRTLIIGTFALKGDSLFSI